MLFGCALKPALCPFYVPVKCKHLLHIFKHVLEGSGTKSTLEVSLVAVVRLLVGLDVLFKVPFWPSVSVLAVDVEVSEHVVEVEIKGMMKTLPSVHVFIVERIVSQLVILVPSFLIRQGFICCRTSYA